MQVVRDYDYSTKGFGPLKERIEIIGQYLTMSTEQQSPPHQDRSHAGGPPNLALHAMQQETDVQVGPP